MNTTDSLKNNLLIAMPGMEDGNFSKTVTYICEHTDDGAMGLILSIPLDITFRQVVGQVDKTLSQREMDKCIDDIPVYLGGPVEPEHGFVLHTPQGEWSASLKLTDDLMLTTSSDIISAIATGEGPDQYLVMLGYAGWGGEQLEHEMAQNAWLNVPADMAPLWGEPAEKRWQKAAALLGVDLSRLSPDVGHA
ncbi:MAG: YqgE/AlgH family protein [Gammaproteobacteria bacterium]|nr:YqgE/AlgH family protein [Gammaproteobacteria bacterium]MCF6231382.1 YqgE/AlgH family protein [Gammaproteobacteria bacterium]